MTTSDLINDKKRLIANTAPYASWGKVDVIRVSIRFDDRIICSNSDESWNNLTEDDFSVHRFSSPSNGDFNLDLHKEIYRRKSKINAILTTHQTNAFKVSEQKANIPPILDDQVQLLGPTVKFVQLREDYQRNIRLAFLGLNGRYGTILSNGSAICVGINLDEAYAAAQVLEKASKSFIEAQKIGGAVGINRFEAWAMHKFYIYKYSREAKKNI